MDRGGWERALPGQEGEVGMGGGRAGVSFTADLGEPPQPPSLPQKVLSSSWLNRRRGHGMVSQMPSKVFESFYLRDGERHRYLRGLGV